ncbi:MAG: transposase [Candidatus Rokubacteria bacterium]|nr:transposase [Candidatus Rokubacteria bacterium]
MPRKRNRVFSREFKEAAVHRMLAEETTVQALAAELQLWPKLLYHWRQQYEQAGVDGFRDSGRPRGRPPTEGTPRPQPAPSVARRRPRSRRKGTEEDPAAARIAELERKVGQQAVELDFFAQALRHIKGSRRPTDGRGTTASSP